MDMNQFTQKAREALQAAQRIAVEYSIIPSSRSICLPHWPSSRMASSRKC